MPSGASPRCHDGGNGGVFILAPEHTRKVTDISTCWLAGMDRDVPGTERVFTHLELQIINSSRKMSACYYVIRSLPLPLLTLSILWHPQKHSPCACM